jgi:hypothetical protein
MQVDVTRWRPGQHTGAGYFGFAADEVEICLTAAEVAQYNLRSHVEANGSGLFCLSVKASDLRRSPVAGLFDLIYPEIQRQREAKDKRDGNLAPPDLTVNFRERAETEQRKQDTPSHSETGYEDRG